MVKENYNILNIFYDCLAGKKEKTDTITTHGIALKFTLVLSKLEEHKEEIINILDNIISEGQSINYYNLKYNKNGEVWGPDYLVELLLILGQAINELEIDFPIDEWGLNSNSKPFIKRREKEMVLKTPSFKNK